MEGVSTANPGDIVEGGQGQGSGKEIKRIGVEVISLALLAETASLAQRVETDEEVKKDHEAYQERVVGLLKNEKELNNLGSIAAAILPRRQVGSGRNLMKRQERFFKNKNRESLKVDLKGLPHQPSSILTVVSSMEEPEEPGLTLKRKLEEEKGTDAEVVAPKGDEVASNSKPKTGGVGHRWLRSKPMTNEDIIYLQRARDTDISHERKRRGSLSLSPMSWLSVERKEGQGQDERLFCSDDEWMSSTPDLSTPLQDPEVSMPITISAPPERLMCDVSQERSLLELEEPPNADKLLDTPPPEDSIMKGDKRPEMEVDIDSSALEMTAYEEIKREGDKNSQKNVWSRLFPFNVRLKPPSVHECLPPPAKMMKYSTKYNTNDKVRQRVRELKYQGLWPATRLPKVYEMPRSKDHWDYVLEEITWMAEDFASEKRWKLNAAKQVAKMVELYHIQKKLKQGEHKISPKQPAIHVSIDLDSRSCPTEDLLTYPEEYGSKDQIWMGKSMDWKDEMEMPFMIYEPPTPPPDEEFELCLDLTVGYLYNYGTMEESQLPRVYEPKRNMRKQVASVKVFNDVNSRVGPPTVISTHALFDRINPEILNFQNIMRSQRAERPLCPWVPGSLPFFYVRPISASAAPQGQFSPSVESWIVQEDALLLETVRNTFQLQYSQCPIFPGHVMNWKYMTDAGKLVGMSFKSQKRSFIRYENVVRLQVDENLSKVASLHSSHSPINFQQAKVNVEFETLRRAKFQTINALRTKRRFAMSNSKGSKVNLEQNKIKMEDILRLNYNINYDKPMRVNEFSKKGLKIVEQKQRQQVVVPTSVAPPKATASPSKEVVSQSSTSTSVATVTVPPGPVPGSPLQLIKMDVSSSPKPPTSPVNRVEIVKCGPLTVEVKTQVPVNPAPHPTTALPLPPRSTIVKPLSPASAALGESTAVKAKETESHSQPPKIVLQESVVDTVGSTDASNDAPAVVVCQPSVSSLSVPSGTLVRPIQKPTQTVIRTSLIPISSSELAQFVQGQTFTPPSSGTQKYVIFRVQPGATINSVNREILHQTMSNLSVSRLMQLQQVGGPTRPAYIRLPTPATATPQSNPPQIPILNTQNRPIPTRAEDVKVTQLALETGPSSVSVNSAVNGPKIGIVLPTPRPRPATTGNTTTISSSRANPPGSTSTQPKPVSGCLATQIRQFGISQFLPKVTRTIRIVSEATGIPQTLVLNPSTPAVAARPLQDVPTVSHLRQPASTLLVCPTPSQTGIQPPRAGLQSIGSIIQAPPTSTPVSAVATSVAVFRTPIVSLQRMEEPQTPTTSPHPPPPIIARSARKEKEVTRPTIISQVRTTPSGQPSLVLVRPAPSPPHNEQANVPDTDPSAGASSGAKEE